MCDEICIIRQGKSVFQGTVEQAKETSGCEKFEDAYLAISGEQKVRSTLFLSNPSVRFVL